MTPRLVHRVCLILMLVVIGLRPIISESFHTEGVRMTAALEGTYDPWVAATLLLDLVTCVAAIVLAVLPGRGGFRRSGIEKGAALIAVAATISSIAAGDKRPAISASFDLLSGCVLTVVLVQLLDSVWKIRLALCVIIASGAVVVAECADQAFWGFADTERMYQQNRVAFWSRQGVPLDAPQVELFEQRMHSREASGFFSHSNVAGGYLLLVGIAALGPLAAAAMRRKGPAGLTGPMVAALIGSACLATVLLTKSNGALVAAGVGVAALAIRAWFADWFARHRARVLRGIAIVVVFGTIGVVGWGLARGGLPGDSLNFRWQYWSASARMFGDHWLTGVGAENFADHYVRYKSIESPEEVRNPHNLFVQFATEHGVLGLVAIIVLLVSAAGAATAGRGARPPQLTPAGSDDGFRQAGVSLLIVTLLVFGFRTLLLGSDDPNLIVWATAIGLIVWVPIAALLMAGFKRTPTAQEDLTGLSVAINCALLAFLLQDMINFASFVPGVRTTAFALLGISIASRSIPTAHSAEANGRADRSSRFQIAATTVLLLVIAIAVPMPVNSEVALRRARRIRNVADASSDVQPVVAAYQQAASRDPLDATAWAELAEWLEHVAVTNSRQTWDLDRALSANEEAIERCPLRVGFWRENARLHMLRSHRSADDQDAVRAVAAMRRAIELYPTRAMGYVELGDCLMARGTPNAATDAIRWYEHALTLDGLRPEWERYRRFNPRTLAEIHQRIERARQSISGTLEE